MSESNETNQRIFTSESVSEGHPDKICDQISDAVLDAFLAGDETSRVAVETMIKDDNLIVAGEVTSSTKVDIREIALGVLDRIGYSPEEIKKYRNKFQNLIGQQSPDISQGVDTGGAGDQGIMHGYAVNETPELMPLDLVIAHNICRRLEFVRRADKNSPLRPDAKAQAGVMFRADKPIALDSLIISTQHSPEIAAAELAEYIFKEVIIPVAAKFLRPFQGDGSQLSDFLVNPHLAGQGNIITQPLEQRGTILYLNPTGKFIIGGAYGDCGLTGRKIVVDNYGGRAPVGGGAFSGKDPSKVDRSGAYMARYLAAWIIKEGYGDEALVSLSYAIGVKEPMSLEVSGRLNICKSKLIGKIKEKFDLSPEGICRFLNLRKRKYEKLWIGDIR